ncbi:TorD/DmsD family molecular chaperone [Desulfurispira natronophila]|uniref:TorA maturation chaperone TorD n=1 Tax=Desulfurispira natronophila TaxID=682562 RepID=A0A7W7Y4M0_9BACT|nr:molecular chaperone TorD family protein [Desulfurispira natronophila]MBB5022003.1 TorA maturation chaperone TorD [Desulfurispira natronophila]
MHTTDENIPAARAYVYRWFSESFLTLHQRQIAIDWNFTPLRDALDYLGFSGFNPLVNILEQLLGQHGESIIEEYFALYYGGQDDPVPPFGSWWIDGGFNGPSTLAVYEYYEQFGMQPDEEVQMLPDHLSIELEFLATLILEAHEYASKGDATQGTYALRAQREFLHTFVQPWLTPFCQRGMELAGKSFQGAWLQLLYEFVNADDAFMATLDKTEASI